MRLFALLTGKRYFLLKLLGMLLAFIDLRWIGALSAGLDVMSRIGLFSCGCAATVGLPTRDRFLEWGMQIDPSCIL